MTREEAKAWFKVLLKDEYAFNSADREAFAMAIKALEQEPCETQMIDKSNFSQEQYKADLQCAYDCGKASVKPCEGVIDRAEAMTEIMMFAGNVKSDEEDIYIKVSDAVQLLRELPPVNPQPKWIPMTTRPMTEEEKEHYIEWSDVEGAMIFDCELPEDGQEVLVSSGGYVCVDTFCTDDGCYFEGVDIDDVDAWMPLPKPYKPQESEE